MNKSVKQPTPDEVLTASLKLIVEEFKELGYDDRIIFGKVNLILQGFITPEGGFTAEYIKLAKEALARKESAEFQKSLEINNNEANGVSLIVPGGGIGGNKL